MIIRNVVEYVWERHQSHWNWIIMMCTVLVFLMTLWFRSFLLFLVFMVGIIASLCELPPAVPPFKLVEKILEIERRWLKSPWSWKKGMQIFGLFSGMIFVGVAAWFGSAMALLLFLGICVNIGCVYGNKAMGIDDL